MYLWLNKLINQTVTMKIIIRISNLVTIIYFVDQEHFMKFISKHNNILHVLLDTKNCISHYLNSKYKYFPSQFILLMNKRIFRNLLYF